MDATEIGRRNAWYLQQNCIRRYANWMIYIWEQKDRKREERSLFTISVRGGTYTRPVHKGRYVNLHSPREHWKEISFRRNILSNPVETIIASLPVALPYFSNRRSIPSAQIVDDLNGVFLATRLYAYLMNTWAYFCCSAQRTEYTRTMVLWPQLRWTLLALIKIKARELF